MAYTPTNNPYIPGDPYSYDLKWIVTKLKEAISLYEPLSADFVELREYVLNYFDNLDVTQEISDKLDEMARNGSLDALLQPFFVDIETRIAAQTENINLLSARMDTFASLPAGSTSGNAELLDIRVGANGNTYSSAGDAVRALDDANTNYIIDNTQGLNIFDPGKYTPNMEYNGSGSLISSSVVGLSDFIRVIQGKTIYFSNDGKAIANYRIYYMVEFDANKTFLRRIVTTTVTSYTPSSDAVYVRAEIVPGVLNTVKLEYGSMSAYAPYASPADMAKGILLASVNMFNSIAGVGDSYTKGLSYNSGGTYEDLPEQSYIATMGKRAGVDWYNYGISGATTRSFITLGLPAILADDPRDLYIIALGQNDINQGLPEGTIADIHTDWTLNADTYYGNYGQIIQRIKNHAPNARIILVKSWLDTNVYGTQTSYQSLDPAIEAIAAYYYLPVISPFDDELFNSYIFKNFRVGGHPTTMLHSMMGLAMERLFSSCVMKNPTYFRYSTIG